MQYVCRCCCPESLLRSTQSKVTLGVQQYPTIVRHPSFQRAGTFTHPATHFLPRGCSTMVPNFCLGHTARRAAKRSHERVARKVARVSVPPTTVPHTHEVRLRRYCIACSWSRPPFHGHRPISFQVTCIKSRATRPVSGSGPHL